LAEYPIPADLIQAFRKAIVAFDDWRRGDVERLINHAGKLCPIDVICSFLGFADEMPDDVYAALCIKAGAGGEPTDRSFASGARCLEALYRALKQRRSPPPAPLPYPSS
jgi:hypothetical protein